MVTYGVECGTDESLLLLLGVPRRRVVHEGNRDEVVKYILKKDAGAYIGIVDADPGTIHGPQRKQFIDGRMDKGHCMSLCGDRKLVVLSPMVEGWLIAAVQECGGKVKDLDKGLSDDPRALHAQLSPRGDKRLKKLIDFLVQRDSEYLRALRKSLGIS
jgi:hypothetical protein